MNASQILALSSVDAREWARHSDDVELLTEVRDAATADTAKPRRTLLAAIDFRLGALSKLAEDTEAEVVRDDSAPLTVEEIAAINEVPVEVVVARLAETAPPPAVEVTTCAQAFVAALRSGDAVLVAAMIADVRRTDVPAGELATELVSAFGVTATVERPARRRSATPPVAPVRPEFDSATLLADIKAFLSNGPATTATLASKFLGASTTPNRRAVRALLRANAFAETKDGPSVVWTFSV